MKQITITTITTEADSLVCTDTVHGGAKVVFF